MFKHGQDTRLLRTSTYVVWKNMNQRCYNTDNPRYKDYGGRGITVCEEWKKSFEQFYKDMGDRPEDKTLGRKDNNGNYCKDNCRWETPEEQGLNRRSNRIITFKGDTKTLSEWAKSSGVPMKSLHWRLKVGWSIEDALTQPRYNRVHK